MTLSTFPKLMGLGKGWLDTLAVTAPCQLSQHPGRPCKPEPVSAGVWSLPARVRRARKDCITQWQLNLSKSISYLIPLMKMYLLYKIGRGIKMEIELVLSPRLNKLSDPDVKAFFFSFKDKYIYSRTQWKLWNFCACGFILTQPSGLTLC